MSDADPGTRESSRRARDRDHPSWVEFRVEDLHKSFANNHVLRGVDATINRGEIVAIVGGSGCGKTVLLEHMIALRQPDSGRVLVADHANAPSPDAPPPLVDLVALDENGLDRIRAHWAIVFQRNALFTGTVYDNLALWLRETRRLKPEQIKPIAVRALAAVGFDQPDRLLARDRDDLSGGMAKRVALARALTMDPLQIFYDEPTTGLDPHHAAHIHTLIADVHYRRNTQDAERLGPRTSIIVTHDKDLLRRLRPRIIMLHEGVVFFDGPFADFEASDSEIIRPYFDAVMSDLQRRHHDA